MIYIPSFLRLTCFTVALVSMVCLVYLSTMDRILKQEMSHQYKVRSEMLKGLDYDSLYESRTYDFQGKKVWEAWKDGEKLADIFTVHALNGYSGAIQFFIAREVKTKRILSVKIISHQETPSLGNYIESSDWLKQFVGYGRKEKRWRVVQDGGDFDARTGATISGRAVVDAIGKTLKDVDEY
jgi:electron transport complex protein RnfG